MTEAEGSFTKEQNLAIVQPCIRNPTQRAWSRFFKHFEPSFRKWIRGALINSSEADREDTFQNFAQQLLSRNILSKINLDEDPAFYLHECIRNLARKHHERATRHPAERLDENTPVIDRFRLIGDHAPHLQENELFERLQTALVAAKLNKKQLTTFMTLLKHKKLKDIVRETGYKMSTVGRYVKQLEAISYTALGVALPKRRKKM